MDADADADVGAQVASIGRRRGEHRGKEDVRTNDEGEKEKRKKRGAETYRDMGGKDFSSEPIGLEAVEISL